MSSTPITYSIEFGAYRTAAIESSLRSAKLLQAVKVCLSGVFIHWTGLEWTGLTQKSVKCLFQCRTEAKHTYSVTKVAPRLDCNSLLKLIKYACDL